MARWVPESRARLERAALELFGERGYDSTTVAQIAQRAGLTERTFFRYFTDKREVLFWGAASLEELLVASVAGAPEALSPIDAAAVGLAAAGAAIEGRREFARRRQAVIVANDELRERELIKLAGLAGALAETLRRRGVDEPAASLTAEVALAVFKTAFERWIGADGDDSLPGVVGDMLADLRTITA